MSRNNTPETPEKSFASDLERILFDETTIQNRVCALAGEINSTYKKRELTIIAIANGAIIFTADLMRKLDLSVRLDCIHVTSYRNQTEPAHSPEIRDRIRLDIKGSDILLIDDILDTGKTLSKISETLRKMQPDSLKTCVLLDKRSRRAVDIEADFVGFDIPDDFVVGYGLDFAERYRQLPYIGVLKDESARI